MSDHDKFSDDVNDVCGELFFHASELQEKFSEDVVLIGMALALSQQLTRAELSPRTVRLLIATLNQGLAYLGPEFNETLDALAKLTDRPDRE
jgi:hypothetical protein